MKLTCFFTLVILTLLSTTSYCQNLSQDIKGKWEIKKFQKDKKPALQGGTLEFLPEGILLTEGIFFGTFKNTFRTDRNNSVLIIQNEEGLTTKWLASIKNDVLRLKSTNNDADSARIYITLMRSKVTDAIKKDDL